MCTCIFIYTHTRDRVVYSAMAPRALLLRTTRGGEKQAGKTTEVKKERARKSHAARVALRVSPPLPSPLTFTLPTSCALSYCPKSVKFIAVCGMQAGCDAILIYISIHIYTYIYAYMYKLMCSAWKQVGTRYIHT